MVLVMISGGSWEVLKGQGRPCWWVLVSLRAKWGPKNKRRRDGFWEVLGGLEGSWEALLVGLGNSLGAPYGQNDVPNTIETSYLS